MLKYWILAIGIGFSSQLVAQQNSTSARVATQTTITELPVSDSNSDTVTVLIEQKAGRYAKPVFHPKPTIIPADSVKVETGSKRQIPKSER
jgi:hypothetical protein